LRFQRKYVRHLNSQTRCQWMCCTSASDSWKSAFASRSWSWQFTRRFCDGLSEQQGACLVYALTTAAHRCAVRLAVLALNNSSTGMSQLQGAITTHTKSKRDRAFDSSSGCAWLHGFVRVETAQNSTISHKQNERTNSNSFSDKQRSQPNDSLAMNQMACVVKLSPLRKGVSTVRGNKSTVLKG
jgi:hypothetical protein